MIPPHPHQEQKICFILHIKSRQQVLGAQQWITEKDLKVTMGLSRKEYLVNCGFETSWLCVSDSVRPQRWQPTTLRRPWDSPGKHTGVGCHFLLQCMKVKSESEVAQSATPWTAAYQAPLSMGFSKEEYWSGLPFSPPGDLPNPGIKPSSPVSLALQAYSLPTEPSRNSSLLYLNVNL